jgi:hypothetical protein
MTFSPSEFHEPGYKKRRKAPFRIRFAAPHRQVVVRVPIIMESLYGEYAGYESHGIAKYCGQAPIRSSLALLPPARQSPACAPATHPLVHLK